MIDYQGSLDCSLVAKLSKRNHQLMMIARRFLLLLLVLQSCPTLCDPIDGSPGILQARTVEWVAISFSNA